MGPIAIARALRRCGVAALRSTTRSRRPATIEIAPRCCCLCSASLGDRIDDERRPVRVQCPGAGVAAAVRKHDANSLRRPKGGHRTADCICGGGAALGEALLAHLATRGMCERTTFSGKPVADMYADRKHPAGKLRKMHVFEADVTSNEVLKGQPESICCCTSCTITKLSNIALS